MGCVLRWAIWFILFMVGAGSVVAQTRVTLYLADGSLAVSGQLLDFDGEYYHLESEFGILTMAASTTICKGPACPDPDDTLPRIRISGSAEIGLVVLPPLIDSFATRRGYRLNSVPGDARSIVLRLQSADGTREIAEFHLGLTTSRDGITSLAAGRTHIALTRRLPIFREREALNQNYDGPSESSFRSRVLGWDKLHLFTSSRNRADILSVGELTAMVGPPPSVWPKHRVGGILPAFFRGDNDSVYALRQQLGVEAPLPGGRLRPTQLRGILTVTNRADLAAKEISVSASCDGMGQDANLRHRAHPLLAPIYMLSPSGQMNPVARDFLEYTLSPPAQRVIARAGFQSRSLESSGLADADGVLVNAILNADNETRLEDLQNITRRLQGFGRLGLTFRFEEGGTKLDDLSRTNLQFLVSLLREGRFRGRQMMFAGFSDSAGIARGNLALSRGRAIALRDTVETLLEDDVDQAGVDMFSQGFGEVFPLACNDTRWGRRVNRRVEVWLSD